MTVDIKKMREELQRDFGRIDKDVLVSIAMQGVQQGISIPSNFEQEYKDGLLQTALAVKPLRMGHGLVTAFIHCDMVCSNIMAEAVSNIEAINKSCELSTTERYDATTALVKIFREKAIRHLMESLDNMEKEVIIPYIFEGKHFDTIIN